MYNKIDEYKLFLSEGVFNKKLYGESEKNYFDAPRGSILVKFGLLCSPRIPSVDKNLIVKKLQPESC